ncbi:MAG: (deoxy)nucleoside triphosphate pyrophosphohydrolase [Candidatus Dojkabacteria bacterium]
MINVVAGILRDQDKVLIGQRPKGKHQEYKWEFPGGKLEENESPENALKREFREELGIDIEIDHFLCEVIYKYSKMEVKVKAYFISTTDKDIKKLEHESILWVPLNELKQYDLVSADVFIVDKILEQSSGQDK